MSQYTLFVDESGNFGSRDGQRIVAGLLVPMSPEKADKNLDALDISGRLRKEYGHDEVLRSSLTKGRLHLTELRTRLGHDKAFSLARSVVEDYALGAKMPLRFLTVIGQKKRIIVDGERTYRLMLLDLIVLAETTIKDVEPLTRLDLIIATRSIDENGDGTYRRMSEDWELGELFFKTLEPSLEMGLVSRGLVELAYGNRFGLQLLRADLSWGLILADFMANLVYNRFQKLEGPLVARLCAARSLHMFNSLGKLEERKARIADRDGDFASALYWWSAVEPKATDETVYAEYFAELFQKIIHQTQYDSAVATLDSLIERLWQQTLTGKTYAQTQRQLQKLEVSLQTVARKGLQDRAAPLLFRLRNFMLVLANHLGDIHSATALIRNQANGGRPPLPFTPETFPLLLDFQLFCIETRVNQLELVAARQLADSYYKLIEGYRAGWDSLSSSPNTSSFEASRAFLKAATTQVRGHLLSNGAAPDDIPVNAYSDQVWAPSVVADRILALQKPSLHPADASRLQNYLIQARLRQKEYLRALQLGLLTLEHADNSNSINAFDVFWAARAANDALLWEGEAARPGAQQVLTWLRKHDRNRSFAAKDHPYELIWRERGLLEALCGSGSEVAQQFYERSIRLYLANENASPINEWLKGLLYLHCSALKGESSACFPSSMTNSRATALRDTVMRQNTQEKLLATARTLSPY